MWSAPNATRCHIDLARIGLGIIDELRNRLGWNRGMNHHDVDRAQQACDRVNITNEIEIKLGIERRVNRVRRRDEKECVAVGGRPYDRLRAEIAAATRSVLDHEWLAKALRQPLADMSAGPPGAKPTMMRTGRVGLACAQAKRETVGSAAATAARRRN